MTQQTAQQMTEYVVLLPGREARWEAASAEERAEVYRRHTDFAKLLADRGHRVTGGSELTHSRTAHVVRRAGDGDGVVVTQGPYAETAEQLSGFYVVESSDLDDLLEICGVLASVEEGVEVRTTVDHTGDAS